MASNSCDGFCRGAFWNTSLLLNNTWPQFTDCFINTVLVWVPCGYVWLLLPYFLYDVNSQHSTNNLQPTDTHSTTRTTSPSNKSHMKTDYGTMKAEEMTKSRLTTACLLKMVLTCLLSALSLIQLLLDVIDGHSPAQTLASALYFATYILVAAQLWYERRKRRMAMFITFYFYLMNVTFGIIPLYTWILTQAYHAHTGKFILVIASFCINCACFIFTFFPDVWSSTEGYVNLGPKASPELTATIPSKLFFWFYLKLIKREVLPEDVSDLHPRDQGSRLNPLFELYWQQEVKRVNTHNRNTSRFSYINTTLDSNDQTEGETRTMTQERESSNMVEENTKTHQTNKKNSEKMFLLRNQGHKIFGTWASAPKIKPAVPNLLRVLWRLERSNILGCFIQKVVSDCLLFAGPLILGALIQSVEQSDERKHWQPYTVLLAMLACNILRSILYTQSIFKSLILSLQLKTVLTSAIYKKVLLMSNSARKNITVGEIVNLVSVDCQRLLENSLWLAFFVSAPVQLLMAFALLYITLGSSTIAGFVIFILSLPIKFWILRELLVIQDSILIIKDKRMKLVTETLVAMKVLKLYAWEDQFKKKVESIRASEINKLYKSAVLYAVLELLITMLPFLISVVMYAAFVLIDENNVLDSNKAFVSLTIFNFLRIPVLGLKVLATLLVQLQISVKRVTDFLVYGEMNPRSCSDSLEAGKPLSVQEGTFAWDLNLQPNLWNINVNFACGKLTAIVGAVGSGKSSLISAILGEMETVHGQVVINGSLAYVSQQAWIQNATVRDNILFGKKFNKHRYTQAIKCCELERDLKILEAGDMTEIGEKGINLSGGQKQRVSLARAVYSDADIFLLDDPLSSVDAHVGKAIFKNVISNSGILAGKTRILVTHGIHWLPQMDHILVLTNGIISESGSYDELVSHKGPFAQFLQTYILDPNNKTDEDSDFISDDDEETVPPVGSKMSKASANVLNAEDLSANLPAQSAGSGSGSGSAHKFVRRQNSQEKQQVIDQHHTDKSLGEDVPDGRLTVDETLVIGKVGVHD